MALYVRRNIRAIGTNELMGPALEVVGLEIIQFKRLDRRGQEPRGIELLTLENGMRVKTNEVLFVEPVDEDLLIAMRLEAQIIDASKERG